MSYTESDIQTAISQILTTGQSWAMGDTRRKAADLDMLFKLEDRQALKTSGKANQLFSLAGFQNAGSESS